MGFAKLPGALVLVFWAYQGFELATLPASEVEDPRRTIPRAIAIGMTIVTAFYLLTNFVVYGAVDWHDLARSKTPLVDVGIVVLGGVGATVMAVGALVSVAGSDESDMLATARLSAAMARRGALPRALGRVHRRFGTPHVALLVQGLLAVALAAYSDLKSLISFSVFTLGVAFFLTCASLLVLGRRARDRTAGDALLPWLGMAACAFLLAVTSGLDKAIGTGVILLGVAVHALSPRAATSTATEDDRNARLEGTRARARRLLGNAMRLGRSAWRRTRGRRPRAAAGRTA
jgi:amino acid transporter